MKGGGRQKRTFGGVTVRRRIRPKVKEELEEREAHYKLHRRKGVELAREDREEERGDEEALDLDPFPAEDLDREEGCVVSFPGTYVSVWGGGTEMGDDSPGTKPRTVMMIPPVETRKSLCQAVPVAPSKPIC